MLEGLVDVQHFKVLLRNASLVASNTVDVGVILVDDVLEALKLLDVFKNNLVEIVLHDVDLHLELEDLSLELGVRVLPLLVLLFGLAVLHLECCFVLLASFALELKILALLLHLTDDLLLVIGEVLADQLLLGLHALHALQLLLILVGLELDI